MHTIHVSWKILQPVLWEEGRMQGMLQKNKRGKKMLTGFTYSLYRRPSLRRKKQMIKINILLQEDCMKGMTQRLKNLNAMSKGYLRSLSLIEMKTEEAFEVIKLVIKNIKFILITNEIKQAQSSHCGSSRLHMFVKLKSYNVRCMQRNAWWEILTSSFTMENFRMPLLLKLQGSLIRLNKYTTLGSPPHHPL